MKYRAVIFDLWQTLVPWDVEESTRFNTEVARTIGVEPERYLEVWLSGDHLPNRNTGPASDYFHALFGKLGVDADLVELGCSFLDPTRCRRSTGFAAAVICSG